MAFVKIQSGGVSTVGTALSVNAAFLAEIKELNRELWMALERLKYLSGRPISMCGQSHEYVDLLVRLRELIAMQFSLEEAYGYFENPTGFEQTFSERAESLRQDHSRLFQAISRLCEAGEEMWRQQRLASLTTIIPVGFDQFYEAFLEHERKERELLSDSLINDIGTGD